jgi:multiple sugar transport system ATP-binding protein
MNFFEGRVEQQDGSIGVAFGDGQRLAVDDAELALAGGLAAQAGRAVVVGVRPEHLEDAALASSTPRDRRLRGLVKLRELLGSELVIHFEVEAAPVVTEETRDLAEDVDASAVAELDHLRAARRTSFVGRFAAEAPTAEGTVAEIAVGPGALRFFDRETGARIGA